MMPGFPAYCMPCILDKHLRAMPDGWDEARRSAFLREAMRVIIEADPAEPAPIVTRRIDDLAQDWQVPLTDFRPIKRLWNGKMLTLAPELRADIQAAPDPLARAMQYARTANYIDFGALTNVNEDELRGLLRRAPEDPLDPTEYDRFREDLAAAKHIAYLADNCGEVVADLLLLEQLSALYPDSRITCVVRGEEVSNDATMEDARMVGLDRVVRVVSNGTGLTGTFIDEIAPVAREALDAADVVISKGQANFETLNGCGLNVYYLFLCKCERFEKQFGIRRLQGVLANDRRLNEKREAIA